MTSNKIIVMHENTYWRYERFILNLDEVFSQFIF